MFSEDELQYFTIPVAEFTAAILNLFVTETALDGAECIVMNIDALAMPQALTTRANNPRMRAVHEEFMADDIFQRLVIERKCLAVKHVWGLGNACADAASRSRMETLERLAWQLSVTLTRQQLPAAAEAFLAKIRRRLSALSATTSRHNLWGHVPQVSGGASTLSALALAALRRCWGTRGKSERPSFATGKRLRLGVVLALAMGRKAAQEGSPSRSLSPVSPLYEPEVSPR